MISLKHHITLLPGLLLLLLALPTHVARCDAETTPRANPLDSYETKQSDGATITFPAGEREFAGEIFLSYRFPLRILDDDSFDAQLANWKKNDLVFLAKKLALEKPTDAMDAAYGQFRDMCRPAVVEEIREARIYYLVDIKAAQAGGFPLPDGIGYNPKTEAISIAHHITAAQPGGARARVVPVVLMQNAPGMLDEKMRLFNATLRDMRWRLDEAVYNAYCGKLHEITRPEVIATIDKAVFPLWVIDGMTNAIPLLVMRSHNPAIDFEHLLKAHVKRPPDFETHAARINLNTWIAPRATASTKPLTDSYSYLALLVILDAIQENGDDWLPDFFEKLRSQNSPALNMANVYAIYTDITGGKDLRANIASVKERLAKKQPPASAPPAGN